MARTVVTLNDVGRGARSAARGYARRFVHISRLIEEFGLERVSSPHVKHVRGVFVKKTQQRPHREIELALKRAKEV